MDCDTLRRWFLTEQRELPWRTLRTPYAVWVSEMMLQQTQVSVVIPYFERWMAKFPTIQTLAEASLDEVIKVWEGLGYYSRARYLHTGARLLVDRYGGELPANYAALKELKGLGEYTVGAILSFAFGQKIPAVDGNVLRVLTRYFCIEEDISKSRTLQEIRARANTLLPDHEPWVINEALIELGATICTKTPHCSRCPIRSGCLAYQQGKTEQLPYKSTKTTTTLLFRGVGVIIHDNHLLLRRNTTGVMADLYEFPYLELSTSEAQQGAILKTNFEETLHLPLHLEEEMGSVSHTFTRYRVKLHPCLFRCTGKRRPNVEAPYSWIAMEDVLHCAFSSGHRRVWHLSLPIAKNKGLLVDTNRLPS